LSERKHTPGDWSVATMNGRRYVLSKGDAVAMEGNAAESAANMDLIAAAPELLEAVDWLVGQLQGDSATGHSYWKQFPEYRAACDAIAKATGGAS
jgi:hypothetical protein